MKANLLRTSILLVALCFSVLLIGPSYASRMPPVERIVLPNGLILLVSEEHSIPLVTFQLLLEAGSSLDPAGQEGLAYVTARGLLLGTSRLTAPQINQTLDFIGASIDVAPGKDYVTVGLRVLKKELDQGYALFLETLMQPSVPGDEIKKQIQRVMGAIQSEDEEPGAVAAKEFEKTLFSANPYGHRVMGTNESLQRITRDGLVRFYKERYSPNRAVLVIVGDITAAEVRGRIIPELERWRMGEMPPTSFQDTHAKGPRTVNVNRAITQANIIMGNVGISRENPDFYALTVMNYILGGGGFSSRLLTEIRAKRGLAYSVASVFDTHKHPGSFYVVLQTKNASAREAISLALKEIERIRKEPVSEKEISGAKKYLIGSFPMRLDTQAKLANFLTQVEYYGLGLDYPQRYPSLINAVTREDVLRVAKTYLHPEKRILVIVANLEEAGIDTKANHE